MTARAGGKIEIADVSVATSPYLAIVSRSTNLSLSSGTLTTVTYTTEHVDTDGLYSAGTPSRFTVQHDGIYQVHFDWLLNSGSALRQLAMIRLNGGETCRQEIRDDDAFIGGGQSIDSVLLQLSASDYIDVQVLQQDSTSSARNLTAARFSILYVSDGS